MNIPESTKNGIFPQPHSAAMWGVETAMNADTSLPSRIQLQYFMLGYQYFAAQLYKATVIHNRDTPCAETDETFIAKRASDAVEVAEQNREEGVRKLTKEVDTFMKEKMKEAFQ